jgi:hypothetical protein
LARTKLTDKQKKKIVADYIESQNYKQTGIKNKVDTETVRRVVKEDEEFAKKLERKKEENTQTTLEYMDKQHETKKRILDKLLKGIELKADDIDMFTNVKDLATAYGIIIDKELKALELKQKRETSEEDLQKVKDILVTIKEVANGD